MCWLISLSRVKQKNIVVWSSTRRNICTLFSHWLPWRTSMPIFGSQLSKTITNSTSMQSSLEPARFFFWLFVCILALFILVRILTLFVLVCILTLLILDVHAAGVAVIYEYVHVFSQQLYSCEIGDQMWLVSTRDEGLRKIIYVQVSGSSVHSQPNIILSPPGVICYCI